MRTVTRLLTGTILTLWLSLLPASVAAATEWMLPLDGEPPITRPFDPPATPYGPGHRGVDLGGSPGQSVRAAGGGTIGYAAPLAGRGVVTVLHSGGLRTTYEPVTASVAVGQSVLVGQPIGTLQAGHRDCPVAACLHWGLLRGEVYLNPMSLLSPGPIRLLPPSDSSRVPLAADSGDSAVTRDEVDSDGVAAGSPDGGVSGGTRVPAAMTVVAGLAVGAAVLTVHGRPP